LLQQKRILLMVAPESIFFFLTIFLGYRVQSGFLQWWFYSRRGQVKEKGDRNKAKQQYLEWKTQPSKGSVGVLWGDPLLSSKPNRAPYHHIIAPFNLFMASCFAGLCAELSIRGSSMSSLRYTVVPIGTCAVEQINSFGDAATYLWHWGQALVQGSHFVYNRDMGLGVIRLSLELGTLVLWQSILEYFWHLLMHTPFFYTRWHKMHHWYKSPEVWDDLYIHPLEAAGYVF
jgi:sterol desaturase/sphingolipid hydroxylase (fatty acid hydroxylase superfamily)